MEAIHLQVIEMRIRSAPTHRRSMLQQGQAALLVLAFVVGQVGSFVHAAVERHTVCSEHGEIVHVPHGVPADDHTAAGAPGHTAAGAPGHTAAGAPGHIAAGDVDTVALADEQASRDVDLDALRDGSAVGDEHAHEHCYLCPASREPLSPAESGDAIAAAMPAAVQISLPALVATGDRARYTLAPKTSPPV